MANFPHFAASIIQGAAKRNPLIFF